jgi:hypothetical protein
VAQLYADFSLLFPRSILNQIASINRLTSLLAEYPRRLTMAAETEVNATLPTFWELLAEKLARQPELLAVARGNCARWLGEGHSAPQRLRAWDELLAAAEQNEAGRRRLREVLAGANEADERLREFHPFAGILTREERRQARELCGYRH